MMIRVEKWRTVDACQDIPPRLGRTKILPQPLVVHMPFSGRMCFIRADLQSRYLEPCQGSDDAPLQNKSRLRLTTSTHLCSATGLVQKAQGLLSVSGA